MIRQPISIVMGHVDSGKTSILDWIRGTAVVKSEAGLITQAISSTNVNLETLKKIMGNVIENLKFKLTIPGILFIDSPGHAAFNNLRKRGGNLADIAILVVDINQGIQDQTLECIQILKQYKTPFVIAANKLDLIHGWQKSDDFLIKNIQNQTQKTQQELDNKIYNLVGGFAQHGFNSERFDRIEDYAKQIAMIPTSTLTGEGLKELLMVLCGLAQKYLEESLKVQTSKKGKATILEIDEVKGLGKTLDLILYDGTLKKNDLLVIGNIGEPIITKVKAILLPDMKGKFKTVDEVAAAMGVKINATDIDQAIPGMPVMVTDKTNLEKDKLEVTKEVSEVIIQTDNQGIVIKANSLGSLEALIGMLKNQKIKIKRASVGNITKKDITDAKAEEDPLNKVILGFNIKKELEDPEIKIISNDVIYRIIEEYLKWLEEKKKQLEQKELDGIVRPSKCIILPGCIFRQNNPAVVGVRVLEGTLRNDSPLMKDNGDKVSYIKSMQHETENTKQAEKNKEVAISIPNITVGRQIDEETILYTDIPENDFIKLKKLKKHLSSQELELLKEIAEIQRKKNPLWGI